MGQQEKNTKFNYAMIRQKNTNQSYIKKMRAYSLNQQSNCTRMIRPNNNNIWGEHPWKGFRPQKRDTHKC